MKRITLFVASLAAVFHGVSLLADSSNPQAADEIERRIERVVNGLLPGAVFINQSRYGPKTTLKERMAHYHTPGVSIAVVNNYKIEWARGFGVREHGKREPVNSGRSTAEVSNRSAWLARLTFTSRAIARRT